MKKLTFDGSAVEEVFEIGDHLTVRYGPHYPLESLVPGEHIRITDKAGRFAVAKLIDAAHSVTFDQFDDHAELFQWERSPYRDPEALKIALLEFYPGTNEHSEWTFIMFKTFLSEGR